MRTNEGNKTKQNGFTLEHTWLIFPTDKSDCTLCQNSTAYAETRIILRLNYCWKKINQAKFSPHTTEYLLLHKDDWEEKAVKLAREIINHQAKEVQGKHKDKLKHPTWHKNPKATTHNFFRLHNKKLSQFLLYLPAGIQAVASLLCHAYTPSDGRHTPASPVLLMMPLVVLKEGYIPTARNYSF